MELVVVALAIALVLMAAAFISIVRVLLRRIDAAEQRAHAAEDRADQAPERSRAVNMGKISEQLAPLLPGFGHDFKDVQWIGGKVDAIVWHGLEAAKCGAGSPDDIEIVFLEVKTGKARVDSDQRLIRAATEAGRVRFEVFRFRPELEIAGLQVEDLAESGFPILGSVTNYIFDGREPEPAD